MNKTARLSCRAIPFVLAFALTCASSHAAVRLFTAPRETPWRMVDDAPDTAEVGHASFSGTARPGEFYVFQIGLLPDAETAPLSVAFSALRGPAGALSTAAMRCLSLGGVGHDGQVFTKEIRVPANAMQILWCGIAVPSSAVGEYRGRIDVSGGAAAVGTIEVALKVEGDPVTDHGDGVAQNLSRLRWLDSTVGCEPTLTAPFVPVTTSDRSIQVLGRELSLGEEGLPARITSFFNAANTRIDALGRPVLAAPFSFVVETEAGTTSWRSRFGALEHDELEARWTGESTAPGLRAEIAGRLDYTGSGEVRLTLHATQDLPVKDIRLEVPWHEAAATYFMGLNQRGGRRPDAGLEWTWDTTKRQDCFWMGDVNAGLMLRFKDEAFVRPLVNIYYPFFPLRLPVSWGNGGSGGVTIPPATNGEVRALAHSGPRVLKAGDTLTFVTELYLTPFRPLDTEKQWSVRFLHPHPNRNADHLRKALAQMDPATGANVLNIHQAQFAAPYINYPYADDSFSELSELTQRGHEKDVKVRVYYTTREVTQNMPELHALHSMNGEIIFPGPGPAARTLIHKKGPHPWLVENLGKDFVPAWVDHIRRPGAEWDLSVITCPDSRWNNFYLEGLKWMLDQADLDGIYIDDTTLDAASLRRARRMLDQRPGRLIDFHTWNHFNGHAGYANNLTIYMELLPYLDRLWIGEGFNCNAAALDYWLIEMSGLPFGLMSEMLQAPNPWRGLVFGETGRQGWSGDPRTIWKAWDEYGIQGTEFIPFYVPDSPVRSDREDVPVTVYRKEGRSLLALASWAKDPCEVELAIDWPALGLNPEKAMLYAPPIQGFQEETVWKPDDAIPVAPGRGFFLVLDERPRTVLAAVADKAPLSVAYRDEFTTPVLEEDWKAVASSSHDVTVGTYANALRVAAPANVHGGAERSLPAMTCAVEVELDPGTDRGQTWGPGLALVWSNGNTAKMNLRLEDMNYELRAGDGNRITGGGVARERPVLVRILLEDERVYFQVRSGDCWKTLQTQSRKGLTGDPVLLRLGKMDASGGWRDFKGRVGPGGESAYRHLRVLAQ